MILKSSIVQVRRASVEDRQKGLSYHMVIGWVAWFVLSQMPWQQFCHQYVALMATLLSSLLLLPIHLHPSTTENRLSVDCETPIFIYSLFCKYSQKSIRHHQTHWFLHYWRLPKVADFLGIILKWILIGWLSRPIRRDFE